MAQARTPGRRPAAWTIILIVALLVVLAGIVWVLGDRTVDQAAEADLTVPPVDLPQTPEIVPPEPPTLPTSPGPTG